VRQVTENICVRRNTYYPAKLTGSALS